MGEQVLQGKQQSTGSFFLHVLSLPAFQQRPSWETDARGKSVAPLFVSWFSYTASHFSCQRKTILARTFSSRSIPVWDSRAFGFGSRTFAVCSSPGHRQL